MNTTIKRLLIYVIAGYYINLAVPHLCPKGRSRIRYTFATSYP